MFCGSRAEVVTANFLLPDSVERAFRQGLNLLNFSRLGLYNVFLTPEQKFFYGQLLFPDTVERVLKPGASFRRVFYSQFFCYLTLSSVYLDQGLQLDKFFHALVLFTMCFLTQSRSSFLANFLLPDSVKRVLNPGA